MRDESISFAGDIVLRALPLHTDPLLQKALLAAQVPGILQFTTPPAPPYSCLSRMQNYRVNRVLVYF